MTTCHYCGVDCSGKFELSVIGSRQAGKTHLLVMAAVDAAVCGDSVAFLVGGTRALQEIRFQDCLERAEYLFPDKISKYSKRAGKQRITFTSGGEISFVDADMENKYDLACYDDVTAERMINAHRSIRSVLW